MGSGGKKGGEGDRGKADLRPARLTSLPLSASPVFTGKSDRRSAHSGSLHTTSYTNWDWDQRKSCSSVAKVRTPRLIHSRPRRGNGQEGREFKGKAGRNHRGVHCKRKNPHAFRGERRGWLAGPAEGIVLREANFQHFLFLAARVCSPSHIYKES